MIDIEPETDNPELSIYYINDPGNPEHHTSIKDLMHSPDAIKFVSEYGATVMVPWTAIQKIEVT